MKVYHWDYVETLADALPGEAIAVAASVEEAIDVIVDRYVSSAYVDRMPRTANAKKAELRRELESRQPTVYDVPYGHCVWGSA